MTQSGGEVQTQAVDNFILLLTNFKLYFKCKTTFIKRKDFSHFLVNFPIRAQERTR